MASKLGARRRRPRKPRGFRYPDHFDAAPRVVFVANLGSSDTDGVIFFSTEISTPPLAEPDGWEAAGTQMTNVTQVAPTALTFQTGDSFGPGALFIMAPNALVRSLSHQPFAGTDGTVGSL